MIDWETSQFPDEKLPRSTGEYKSFRCICMPDEKREGRFGISVFGSQGEFLKKDYRLLILYEYWSDTLFKGYVTLEEAQLACIDIVERYIKGQLKPTIIEPGQSSISETNAEGVPIRGYKKSRSRR